MREKIILGCVKFSCGFFVTPVATQDFTDEKPMAWSHFNAEGDVEFKAVLYVPPKAPHDLYESYYNSNKANLKLYVRRVFISDEFDELLPKYLSFLKVNLIGRQINGYLQYKFKG